MPKDKRRSPLALSRTTNVQKMIDGDRWAQFVHAALARPPSCAYERPSIENARPTTFDVVFGMEDDIRTVIDYTSVLANGLLDEDVPADISSGLIRVACDARQAGHRLMEQFNTALELARQDKRA